MLGCFFGRSEICDLVLLFEGYLSPAVHKIRLSMLHLRETPHLEVGFHISIIKSKCEAPVPSFTSANSTDLHH